VAWDGWTGTLGFETTGVWYKGSDGTDVNTADVGVVAGRGLHSFTFQLNLSALYGIGGARRGCVARIKGVSGGV